MAPAELKILIEPSAAGCTTTRFGALRPAYAFGRQAGHSGDCRLKRTSSLGQLSAVSQTAEKRCADLCLQIPDLLTERRLTDADASGGAG